MAHTLRPSMLMSSHMKPSFYLPLGDAVPLFQWGKLLFSRAQQVNDESLLLLAGMKLVRACNIGMDIKEFAPVRFSIHTLFEPSYVQVLWRCGSALGEAAEKAETNSNVESRMQALSKELQVHPLLTPFKTIPSDCKQHAIRQEPRIDLTSKVQKISYCMLQSAK